MISSGDKHNILSSLGKTPAKVSPYAPSPKDSDTHDDLLKKVFFDYCSITLSYRDMHYVILARADKGSVGTFLMVFP
jgi:hypothetical protein